MTLTISNYKIMVYTKEALVKPDSIKVSKSDYGLLGYGQHWHFKVYKQVIPPKFVNVTGIRCLLAELPVIKDIIRTMYRVQWSHVKINQVFCSRSYGEQKSSYCLARMKSLGEQLFGQNFIFFYEPELGSVLQMSSRQKPNLCIMMYGTSSVCCFLPGQHYIHFCEYVLKQLYVESNLKRPTTIPNNSLLVTDQSPVDHGEIKKTKKVAGGTEIDKD